MKPWFVLAFISALSYTSSAQNSTTSFTVVGKEFAGQRTIFGYTVEVENKRFDQVLVDTARMLVKVRLTGVTKEGIPTAWRARSLAVYDLATLQMKWSKNFPGMQTILMTDHYMTFSMPAYVPQGSAHSLDVNTGKQLWKIFPSLWYIDDKTGIGLSVDRQARIQGINLATGKILWERKMEKTFTGRSVTRLNDSTLLFNDMGLQTLNLMTGEGWIYDATSMSKYRNTSDVVLGTVDVIGILVGVGPTGGNKHVVRNVNSNVILEEDRIYLAARDRITCLTRNGKLVWERFFSKDTASMMSTSSLVSKEGRLYLINEGHAEVNFLDEPYGKPFIASFSAANGSTYFLKKLDYEEPIRAIRSTDSSFVVLTSKAIAEYRLKDGTRSRFKITKPEEPALKSFAAEDLLFRSTDDTTHFGQIIAGDNKHYVVTEKQSLAVFDAALDELGMIPSEDYFVNWLEHQGYQFIGNGKRTILLDRSGKSLATLSLTTNSWRRGDRVYSANGNKLTVVKLNDIIPQKRK